MKQVYFFPLMMFFIITLMFLARTMNAKAVPARAATPVPGTTMPVLHALPDRPINEPFQAEASTP